ncbi:MAG: 1-(5-phosphoribosyl)-5-[Clostridia bacterium]|nr:1-(5-phosphoribosyl)-5-[(5-phosphoribosylamino)methylideneamino]imidazole-4-carboxamide isomerase [Clostridia bacterium]
MNIFPAIDLYEGQAVRLYKGDYAQMTVYDQDPLNVARKFEAAGAKYLHMVDLEGARYGTTPNLKTIEKIVQNTNLFVELGGGIRSMETIRAYRTIGVNRVILGTAAVTEKGFVEQAVAEFGDAIAVGADIKDGMVAIKGWTEKSALTCDDFCARMQEIGVKTMIVTDISRDGAMQGTNRALYASLSARYSIHFIASGGVSSMEDIRALRAQKLYGAIIGKAYYTGAIDLAQAIKEASV